MKNIDKYIFVLIFIACMIMILSCKDNNRYRDEVNGANNQETYTSEGTISSGTKDTMNEHTNTNQANRADSTNIEVESKGEVTPKQ